jgi:transketolase
MSLIQTINPPATQQPDELFSIAQQCRRDVVDMLTSVNSSHLGCTFSILDILVVLYHRIVSVDAIKKQLASRDYVLLSKGHAASGLYAVLASVELLPRQMLSNYHQGFLAGHQTRKTYYGIEISTGSLGHGPSLAVGMALAAKHDGLPSHFFVIVGDGECQEGSVWEAITMAVRLNLDNLTIIVDYNNLQGLDRSDDIATEPLDGKFKAFGCTVLHTDGHDHQALLSTLTTPNTPQRPNVVIAHTTKAKGIHFMENKLEWHYKSCKPDEYAIVSQILGPQ